MHGDCEGDLLCDGIFGLCLNCFNGKWEEEVETDVDCGGFCSIYSECGRGQMCQQDQDCTGSGFGRCQKDCWDDLWDQKEVPNYRDWSNSRPHGYCNGCPTGRTCNDDGDCLEGACNTNCQFGPMTPLLYQPKPFGGRCGGCLLHDMCKEAEDCVDASDCLGGWARQPDADIGFQGTCNACSLTIAGWTRCNGNSDCPHTDCTRAAFGESCIFNCWTSTPGRHPEDDERCEYLGTCTASGILTESLEYELSEFNINCDCSDSSNPTTCGDLCTSLCPRLCEIVTIYGSVYTTTISSKVSVTCAC